MNLDTPYQLAPDQVARFQRDGYIKLKNVLDAATLDHYGREITDWVLKLNRQSKPMHERTTYEKAFLQVMNLWRQSEVVKEFVFSRRLARLAAELLGTRGVRLYHDQALYKEPGGGLTPWHADQQYWPLATDKCCTVWVPLQATPREMGPLAFSVGSHRVATGRDLPISDESEHKISKMLLEKKLPQDEAPFDLGEVSFHYGWTFHRAGPNTSDRPRRVMTVIYLDVDMRLAQPRNKNQERDWNSWCPGAVVGEIINTPLNPVLAEG
jgi:ectoine hydroxylase-related dioxygenase (phytanoyl-CoA dioxygenase family)